MEYPKGRLNSALPTDYERFREGIPVIIRTLTEKKGDSPHWHRHVQIWYVLKGQYNHIIGDKTYTLSAGDVAVIPPYLAHNIDTTNSENPCVLSLEFEDSFLNRDGVSFFSSGVGGVVLGSVKLPERATLCGQNKEAADLLANEMLGEFSKRLEMSISGIRDSVVKFLDILATNDGKPVAPRECTALRARAEAIDRAVAFMMENFNKKISITDVCKIAAMSKSVFFVAFKEVTGRTFSDYLKRLRVQRVDKLLLYTDKNICEIADECGFSDSSHLIHVMTDFFDMTPVKFKESSVSWRKLIGHPQYLEWMKEWSWLYK